MPELTAVHDRLRAILALCRNEHVATKDGPNGLALELPGLEGKPWGYVAGTRLGKRYISYSLMGAYASPELKDAMSPEIRRRMQGKACFNFSRIDEELFAELAALTARIIPGFRATAEAIAAGRR